MTASEKITVMFWNGDTWNMPDDLGNIPFVFTMIHPDVASRLGYSLVPIEGAHLLPLFFLWDVLSQQVGCISFQNNTGCRVSTLVHAGFQCLLSTSAGLRSPERDGTKPYQMLRLNVVV
jgi:hypothetical protein